MTPTLPPVPRVVISDDALRDITTKIEMMFSPAASTRSNSRSARTPRLLTFNLAPAPLDTLAEEGEEAPQKADSLLSTGSREVTLRKELHTQQLKTLEAKQDEAMQRLRQERQAARVSLDMSLGKAKRSPNLEA